MKRTVQWQQATAAGLLVALSAGTSLGQTAQSSPRDDEQPAVRPVQPARAKGVRRPVIDLERMARERRPGQVLPGDPPPFSDKPSTPGVLPRDLLAPIPRQPARAAEPATPPAAAVPAPITTTPPPERQAPPAPMPASRPDPVEVAPAPAPAPVPVPAPAATEAAEPSVRMQSGVMVSEIFTGAAPPTPPVAPTAVSAPIAAIEPRAIEPTVQAEPPAPAPAPEPAAQVAAPAPAPAPDAEPELRMSIAPPEADRPAEPPVAPPPEPIVAAPAPVPPPSATPMPIPEPSAAPIVAVAPVPRPARADDRGVSPVPTPAPVAVADPPRDVPPAREQAMGLLDDRIVPRMPAPASFGPARVSLRSVAGDPSQAQWRTGSTAWRSPEVGESVEGRVEVRAGIDADVRIVIDDAVEVTVARLGRVVIERAVEVGGGTLPAITVARGAIEVRMLKEEGAGSENAHARVRTPDQTFGVRGGIRVEYDAFGGTRRSALPG